MSKNSNQEEPANKGGRYPEKNAKFFTMKGNRSDELEILKMEFGADGIDFYVSVFETLCVSDYFIYHFQNKHKLQLLAKKKEIEKERFLEILKFCVDELFLFNKELYEKGYIFSETFLNTFESGGLFKSRTITAEDVRNQVKTLLAELNRQLTQVNPNLASVQDPILKDITINDTKEKVEDSKQKESISKVETKSNNTRASENIKGESEKTDFPLDDDENIPF